MSSIDKKLSLFSDIWPPEILLIQHLQLPAGTIWLSMGEKTIKIPFLMVNWLDSLHARLNSHLEVWSYVKKKRKNIKAYKKSVRKELTVKRCLLILELIAI